jgi:hypothetical protein
LHRRSKRGPLRTSDATKPLPSPHHFPPSNCALTHRNEPNYSAIEAPPPSPAVTHRHLHPEQPQPPIKGEHHPQVSPHPSSPLFSPCLSIALTEHRHHRFYTAIARPPRRSSTLGEALDRTLANSSSFPCSRGEISWIGAPVGRAPVSSSGRRQRPVHDVPELWWSTDSWTRSTGFPLGKQFPKTPISDILHLGPSVSSKLTRSPGIYS